MADWTAVYLQQMLGEEVVLEEIASIASKVAISQSGTPLENAVAGSVPDQNPNGNSIESQGAATESEGWFNPLKSNSNKHS